MPKNQNRNSPTKPAEAYSITSVIQAMIIMAEMARAALVLAETANGDSQTAAPAPRQNRVCAKRRDMLRGFTAETRGPAAGVSMAAKASSGPINPSAASSLRDLREASLADR